MGDVRANLRVLAERSMRKGIELWESNQDHNLSALEFDKSMRYEQAAQEEKPYPFAQILQPSRIEERLNFTSTAILISAVIMIAVWGGLWLASH